MSINVSRLRYDEYLLLCCYTVNLWYASPILWYNLRFYFSFLRLYYLSIPHHKFPLNPHKIHTYYLPRADFWWMNTSVREALTDGGATKGRSLHFDIRGLITYYRLCSGDRRRSVRTWHRRYLSTKSLRADRKYSA